jgi:predicted ATPase/class 3 adenylate cyclase
MSELPTGVVTFLFTDVVGSTRLWDEHHNAMEADLVVHDMVVRSAIKDRDGYVFSAGGDSFVAAFTRPVDAIDAAAHAQRELGVADWSLPEGLRVRMGVHTGAAAERGGDYFGPTLNEAARLMSAAHGGQIVLSSRTHELAPDAETVSLGAHRLRDLREPIEVFQVAADGLADSFPPLHSLGTGLSTLPEHRSSFVGRREEIDRVRRSVAGSRLVTLTGVGGVGKTRLAIEAAAEEVSSHPGGVFFIDLATVNEPKRVLAAVLTGIGLTASDPTLFHAELIDFLSERTALLVVDNCEHLLDPVAELVDDLLTNAPQLSVLATSRESLDVEGEQVIRVPSLEAEGAALRLFVDRAMAVNDRFDPDVERERIVALCARLDGIPLAIELAATATPTLGPAELLAGLDDRFTLLHGGRRRGAVGRQRTLEATIDWSHDLLDDDEQVAFRRLGIFSGPFIFDVVPTVLGLPDNQARVVLERLVAKSLVLPFRIEQDRTGFRLLETLRIYASGKLAVAGERDAIAARLVAAFVQWVEDSWIAAWRGDWTFWRCWLAQIADAGRVVDDLMEAGRIEEVEPLLGISINGSGSPAWDEERLRRLELIDRNHLHELDLPTQANVVGSLALALMNQARVAEWMERSTSGWAECDSVPMVDKQALLYNQLIALALFDPQHGIQLADEALAELGPSDLDQVYRQFLLWMKANCVGSLHDFDEAAELAERSFVPQDSELRDHGLTTWLWSSHLAGIDVDPGRLAIARSTDPAEGYWRPSMRIAAAMHLGGEESISAELVWITDRGWNGLLPNEEAEYLVAFARLAQLRGDEDRARDLVAATGIRTPWGAFLLVEISRSIDDWPLEEWSTRLTEIVLDRTSPDRLEEIRRTAGPLLADEIDRCR